MSNNLLRRLFLVITRRYRSFMSLVAKRPPSSCNIGLKSGGITGKTDKIIHSGSLSELIKASIVSKRLIKRRRLSVRAPSRFSKTIFFSFSKSIFSNKVLTASAPVPALKASKPSVIFNSRYSSSDKISFSFNSVSLGSVTTHD